jgi:nitrogen regulatory protein PII
MVKIEAIIQPFKLDEVRSTLAALGVAGTLTLHVVAHGDGDAKSYYRGAQYPVDLPRVKIELLASAERVDEIVGALINAARSTVPGDDGTILVYEVADAIRIRTGAHLQYTLT